MSLIAEQPTFKFDFEFLHREYTAEVWHYEQLTMEEKNRFSLTENAFLVNLEGPKKYEPFELYIAEDLEWHTKENFTGTDEIIQIIGEKIDSLSI